MLTDTDVRAAKPAAKEYKLAAERAMYLLVKPDGAKYWRMKYRFEGREKKLALGVYPEVSLKLAREKRDEARQQLVAGIDPGAKRQAEKLAHADTFGAIGREWLETQRKKLAASTFAKAQWMLNDLLFPHLENKPIGSITPQEALRVLRKIEARGKHETAHRCRQRGSKVYRYAIATGRDITDPFGSLTDALAPVVTENMAAITEPKKIGELLRSIDGYRGQAPVVAALKLAPLVFVRPIELRGAEWTEIDLDAAEWRIAAERNKMREVHIVPLSTQAIAILKELHEVTGRGRLVFPSLHSRERPISENSVTSALRRMGYSGDEMTWHGFRALASTRLNELGYAPDVIELQMQHKERNKVRASYNRAERLDERRKLMQQWSDYLEGIKSGSNVIPFRSVG